jgi:hypothetical protein
MGGEAGPPRTGPLRTAEPPADPIVPVAIEHNVDELGGSDAPVYDFLDYHFERGGEVARARSYRDEPHEASLYLPAEGVSESFRADVMTYLRRRFRVLKRLDARKGYLRIED